jgi:predicted acyltransferase
MDQFRGYTVAGMFIVNFVGGMAAIHPTFKHHNVYFSYADSIMPSFMFACGFSYRLSLLKRLPLAGAGAAYGRVIVRSLALMLLSLVLYGFGNEFESFAEMTRGGIWDFVAKVLKADLWEVLAIIGAAQLLILPVIARGTGARLLTMIGFLVVHGLISHAFNYDFVHGKPNWLSSYWGVEKARSWDGGFFGVMMWAVPMLAGSLVYDLMDSRGARVAVGRLLGWGLLLMALGYGLSCLTRLYDVPPGDETLRARLAASPVRPPLDLLADRSWESLLAEPPLYPPPGPEIRLANYWRMDKRIVGPSFVIFSTGLAVALYGLFVVACDLGGLAAGLFRTLGQNPLAAYIIHHKVGDTMGALVPDDSPLWWCCVAIGVYYLISYAFVRYLEKQKIFLRL